MIEQEYEALINKGFKIYKTDQSKIYIRTKRGQWAIVSDYSKERWTDIQNNHKTLVDYGR